jgi:uncharacterized membrane protein YwaF
MGIPKKIFFSYSNQAEDLELYKRINKHFAAYAGIGLLGIIDRTELFKMTADKTAVAEILKSSDIAILLLSIDYITDAECLQQLETASLNQMKIVPVLLRDFDWEAFNKITQYRQQMLPDDHKPVENHITSGSNDDTVFKEIAQNVKAIIFPEIGKLQVQKTSHSFYYIIAALVFIIGIVVSVIVYSLTDGFEQTQRILFTVLSLLMFASIGLIALKNVLFPNKLNIKK